MSQNSIYHILDLDIQEGHEHTTKRKRMQEMLKNDEEAFETSLASLCLLDYEKKSDEKNSENENGGGGLNMSMISILSTCSEVGTES